MNATVHAEKAYAIIGRRSWMNIAVQTGSGFFGFPFTIAVDAAVIPLYRKMWNEIRAIYGAAPIEVEGAKALIIGVGPIVLADIIVDQTVGQVPILGMPANFFCAKVLTWRMGAMFAFFASYGRPVDSMLAASTMEFLRLLFPRERFGFWKQPDKALFVDLVASAAYWDRDELQERIAEAVDVMKGRPSSGRGAK